MTGGRRHSDLTVVVVGGGIVGTTLSHRLAAEGARVHLVEQSYPGSGTSGRTVAWLNAFGKRPRNYHDLNLRGIAAHRRLQQELGGEWLHVRGGWHWEDETGAGFCEDLGETVDRLRAWGTGVEAVSPDDVRRLEPALALDAATVSEAFLVRDEGWLYPGLLIQDVLARARRDHRVELVTDRVTGLSIGDGGHCVALASGRRLEADLVVIAAGAATDEVAAFAGVTVPLRRTVGVLGVTAPCPADLRRVVVAPQVVARPDGGGRLLIGSRETLDIDPEADVSFESGPVRRLQDHARDLLPDLAGVPLEALRRGVRVVPSDGLPVVGRSPDATGPYLVVCHSGVTLAAALAELVSDDLANGGSSTLEPYRPTRFAG